MKTVTKLLAPALVWLGFTQASAQDEASFYSIEVTDISGRSFSMAEYSGKALLIVNTASKCGLTPQYTELQALHEKYAPAGLVVLGFPCNQFAGQEPGSSSDIAEFCSINYGVSFQMFSKIDVNGDSAHPLFVYLKKHAPGFLGSEAIKWNFTKFLVTPEGKVYARYAPSSSPLSISGDIEKVLSRQ
jgi:glutathione peroxidase